MSCKEHSFFFKTKNSTDISYQMRGEATSVLLLDGRMSRVNAAN